MNSYFIYILFFIGILYGCSDQTSRIEEVLQKDHSISEKTLKLVDGNIDNQGVSYSLASVIQDRLALIRSMEDSYDGKNEEIAFVIAFLNAENDYCISFYDQAVAIRNAKRFNAASASMGFYQINNFDADSKRRAQKIVRIHKELIQTELHLSKFHWLPVWAKMKFDLFAQN